MLKLVILCDFAEEGWYSMDLAAEMLYQELSKLSGVEVVKFQPKFRVVFGANGPLAKVRRNADRFFNRFVTYPSQIKTLVDENSFFHIADHSYAQLAHGLPKGRVGVYCHDLDAFRSILRPAEEPRSWLFKHMTKRIWHGFKQCHLVFYSTDFIGAQIKLALGSEQKPLVKATLGVAPVFFDMPQLPAISQTVRTLVESGTPFILHVGSCIPRKRVDILLKAFSQISQQRKNLNLIQVGGTWQHEHRQQINQAGISRQIFQLQNVAKTELAYLYKHCALVALCSDYEGFGLPLIEALAAGARVVATDIPAFREVGQTMVTYYQAGSDLALMNSTNELLDRPDSSNEKSQRQDYARKYSWKQHAQIIYESYLSLSRDRKI